jgi:hypothetical protein
MSGYIIQVFFADGLSVELEHAEYARRHAVFQRKVRDREHGTQHRRHARCHKNDDDNDIEAKSHPARN